MKTWTIPPPDSISNYVSDILVIENYKYDYDFVLPLFANGSPTIVFNTAKAISRNHHINNLTLYGQTVKPNELFIRNEFTLIAYFLYPHSIISLFGLSAGELTDECIEVNFLKQSRDYNLQEQLLNISSLNRRLNLLNRFIEKLSDSAIKVNSKVEFATRQIKKSNGQILLQEVQKELGITERTLQRLFETNIGISPNTYNRVCQFHSAFQQFNQNQFRKFSDIAYENGFADQSHFIRVFKEFTNLTPSEYLKNMKSILSES